MSAPDYDVIIVGAGIAGAALTRSLLGSGLKLALIETKPVSTAALQAPEQAGGPADFDPRVSAITPASQAQLEALGVWPALAATRICPYRAMDVWDAEGTGRIQFNAAEVDVPVLGHIIENRLLTGALLAGLETAPELDLLSPAQVADLDWQDETVSVRLADARELRARLLVAADGALSPLRSLAAFTTREWDYGHRALVATVEVEKAHGDCAYQRFLETGPLAFLPLPDASGRHFCSIVWSAQSDRAQELIDQSDALFGESLAAALEYRLGAVIAQSERVAFPLRQRHATDYVRPGMALVGDAAHTIHPLAGQGINLGLKDVAVLAAEIKTATRRGIPPGELSVLRRYQRQRKGENLAMMLAMDGFKQLFGERRLPLRWLRNQGMQWVSRATPLKQQLMRQAMGIR